jgi:hypothetical protein
MKIEYQNENAVRKTQVEVWLADDSKINDSVTERGERHCLPGGYLARETHPRTRGPFLSIRGLGQRIDTVLSCRYMLQWSFTVGKGSSSAELGGWFLLITVSSFVRISVDLTLTLAGVP